jgi:hypothetical protein
MHLAPFTFTFFLNFFFNFFIVYFNKKCILKTLRGPHKNRSRAACGPRAAGCAPLHYTLQARGLAAEAPICYVVNTSSHQITEVKQCRARSVVGWATAVKS